MARITVEDCLKHIPNRFELTLAATYRARQLATGASPLVDTNKDKPTVIALREIASQQVGAEILKTKIRRPRRPQEADPNPLSLSVNAVIPPAAAEAPMSEAE